LRGEGKETIDRRRVSAFHHRKRRHADCKKNIRNVSRVPGKDEQREAGAKDRTGHGEIGKQFHRHIVILSTETYYLFNSWRYPGPGFQCRNAKFKYEITMGGYVA
jgi:hypothetical protein